MILKQMPHCLMHTKNWIMEELITCQNASATE